MTEACAVCCGADSFELDSRARVPVAQNLLFATREAALACATGKLALRRCSSCGFSWNAAFDPRRLAYDEAYDNDQTFSMHFREHVGAVADAVARRLADSGPVDLLEIGCGQGGFLAVVAERLGGAWRSGLGFDPAWKGDSSLLPERTEVRRRYFEAGELRPGERPRSAVVSRHVIEHLPDPIGHLRAIRAAVPEGTPVFVETPDVDWSLRSTAFFDFYYEHCSLFTGFALRLALESSGFAVEDVRSLFEDQYLFVTARAAAPASASSPSAGRFDDLGYRTARTSFAASLEDWIERPGGGRLALWGAGSKGVTIALMLNDGLERIECAIDVNPRKQGSFMPCSGTPILSPFEAARLGVRRAIVVNPAYFSEVASFCAEEGLPIELLPIDAIGGYSEDPSRGPETGSRCEA